MNLADAQGPGSVLAEGGGLGQAAKSIHGGGGRRQGDPWGLV